MLLRAGEMAPQLRALVTLAEDLSLIPSTNMAPQTVASVPGYLTSLPTYMQASIHTLKMFKKKCALSISLYGTELGIPSYVAGEEP